MKKVIIIFLVILLLISIMAVCAIPYYNYIKAPYKADVTAEVVKLDKEERTKQEDDGEVTYYAYWITWEFEVNGEKKYINKTESSSISSEWSVGQKQDMKIYSEDGVNYKMLYVDSDSLYALELVIVLFGVGGITSLVLKKIKKK